MRVSLWRQFSSNNSSSYVIVGAFATPERANEAAGEFKTLLQKLWDWYQAHPDVREAVLGEENHPLTDAERAIMREYPLEFDEAIEWVARETSLDFLPDAVTTFENLLFVATVDETKTQDKPLAQFMHHLGADVKFEQAMESHLTVHVSARPPDEITANFIKAAAEDYLKYPLWSVAPWALFFGGQFVPNPEQVSRDIDIFFENHAAWSAWHDEHRAELNDLSKQREDAWRAKDDSAAKILDEQIRTLLAGQYEVEPRLPVEVEQYIKRVVHFTFAETLEDDQPIVIEDGIVKFPELVFFDEIGYGLPAIVMWLRALGCTDVRYEFDPITWRPSDDPADDPADGQ
jgi:hypothetical protein